jgi:hypothetical protein
LSELQIRRLRRALLLRWDLICLLISPLSKPLAGARKLAAHRSANAAKDAATGRPEPVFMDCRQIRSTYAEFRADSSPNDRSQLTAPSPRPRPDFPFGFARLLCYTSRCLHLFFDNTVAIEQSIGKLLRGAFAPLRMATCSGGVASSRRSGNVDEVPGVASSCKFTRNWQRDC